MIKSRGLTRFLLKNIDATSKTRYDERKKKGVIQNDKNAEAILKILFEHSVIGNVPSINNQAIFKYEKNSAKFNFKENIIIHRGLYKVLQIF